VVVFVSIRGADKFPEMIRKTPAKPIKVCLQSGAKDLNVIFGSWALKNKSWQRRCNIAAMIISLFLDRENIALNTAHLFFLKRCDGFGAIIVDNNSCRKTNL